VKSKRASGKRGETSHACPNGGLPRRLKGVARSHARAARERGRQWDATRSRVLIRLDKSGLVGRLTISKIAPLNLNLFLVTLEAGETGVPKGSVHSSA